MHEDRIRAKVQNEQPDKKAFLILVPPHEMNEDTIHVRIQSLNGNLLAQSNEAVGA